MISVKIRHYNLGLLKHLAEIDITIYILPFDENIYFGFFCDLFRARTIVITYVIL